MREDLISHVTHRNASLTAAGRRKHFELVVRDSWVQARVTERQQVSRATVSKWCPATAPMVLLVCRTDPRAHMPRHGQTAKRTERRIIALRFTRRWGHHHIGNHLRLPQSTVSKVLNRHNIPLLGHIDPPRLLIRTPRPIHYEHPNPGDLAHIHGNS